MSDEARAMRAVVEKLEEIAKKLDEILARLPPPTPPAGGLGHGGEP